jgi:hypothetical protein
MEERKPDKGCRLTEEERRLKERLMRRKPEPGEIRRGSGRSPKIPSTREERRALIRQIARSGQPEDIRPGRPISEEFWKLPKPEDPEGLALRYLLEDRRQGR